MHEFRSFLCQKSYKYRHQLSVLESALPTCIIRLAPAGTDVCRRHKLGVSQEEFADMCQLDRTYIGGIERGERNVALVNIEKIAKALRISLLELFRGVLPL